jgi:hypothetical protein
MRINKSTKKHSKIYLNNWNKGEVTAAKPTVDNTQLWHYKDNAQQGVFEGNF